MQCKEGCGAQSVRAAWWVVWCPGNQNICCPVPIALSLHHRQPKRRVTFQHTSLCVPKRRRCCVTPLIYWNCFNKDRNTEKRQHGGVNLIKKILVKILPLKKSVKLADIDKSLVWSKSTRLGFQTVHTYHNYMSVDLIPQFGHRWLQVHKISLYKKRGLFRKAKLCPYETLKATNILQYTGTNQR